MSGPYFPAGFEQRKDYFDSDGDSDDGLNDIVYPEIKPSIKIIPTLDGNEADDKSPSDNGQSKRDSSDDDFKIKESENEKEFVINWFNEVEQRPPSSSNSLSPDLSQNRETRSPSPGMLLMEDIRLATINGDLDYIKQQMSIDHGFFIDTVLKNGWTVLMFACDFGFSHIVEYCLEHNADPNYHYDGFTPLMAACQSFYADEDQVLVIVAILLKAGAMINSKDLLGKTALMYACETGKMETAILLVQNGADLSIKDCKQWTCLHFAAKRGFGPVVRNMIDFGAKLNVYNDVGQSPVDLALESGYHELGVLLQKIKAREEISVEEEGILMKPEPLQTPEKADERFYLTELQHFLGEIGLANLSKFFEDQKLTYNDIMHFNETDIDNLAIDKYGEKLKLWEGIKKAHKRNWKPSSVSYLKQKSRLSCLEAHVILLHMSNQMRYMTNTFEYLRNHLKNDPEFLKRGIEKTDAFKLLEQAKVTFREGNLSLNTLQQLVQEITEKSSEGDEGANKNHQSNGNKPMDLQKKPEENKSNTRSQSPSFINVAMATSGALGIGALVYFRKGLITSFLPQK